MPSPTEASEARFIFESGSIKNNELEGSGLDKPAELQVAEKFEDQIDNISAQAEEAQEEKEADDKELIKDFAEAGTKFDKIGEEESEPPVKVLKLSVGDDTPEVAAPGAEGLVSERNSEPVMVALEPMKIEINEGGEKSTAPEISALEISTPEVSPAIESDQESIKQIFAEAGKKIMDGWDIYKQISVRSEQVEKIQDLAGQISYISENFNKKKMENGEQREYFDIYSSVISMLYKIKNKSEINLAVQKIASESGNKIELNNAEGWSAQEANEYVKVLSESLKSLVSISSEDQTKLDNFLYDLGEILLYRKDEDSLR